MLNLMPIVYLCLSCLLWVDIFSSAFECHNFLMLLGRSTTKWKQCPDMTIAVDWDAEPQIKQTVFPGQAKNLLESCS